VILVPVLVTERLERCPELGDLRLDGREAFADARFV